MTDYVKKALDRLKNCNTKRSQYAPHYWSVPAYGKRPQMAPDLDESDLLKNPTKRIQSILGTMIYYAWPVDPTMLQDINEIFPVQSRPTRDTEKNQEFYLDYAETYPKAILSYRDSDMVLHVDSDAACLTMP